MSLVAIFGHLYVLLIVFKVLSSLFGFSRVITGLELHWMRNRPARGKEEKKIWFGVFYAEQSSGAAWVLILAT